MAATPSTPTATEAVDEAMRTIAETSRRSTEGAKAAAKVTRNYLDEAGQINRKVFGLYASGVEANLKANFEVQNAALNATLTFLDAFGGNTKGALQSWVEVTRQSQQAILEGWQAYVKTADKLALEAKSEKA